MSRYSKTQKQIKNGKSYYQTTVYKKVSEKNSDGYFIAQEGDRCDNLANEFYGNPRLWWFVARVNNLTTMNIPPGISLRIPISIENAIGF